MKSIGILDLLTILFIGLKLAGKIDWNWIWVFSPIWIAMICYTLLAIVLVLAEKQKMKDPNYRARKNAEAIVRGIIEKSEAQRKMFE